ncbi:MAG TPA: glycosyltransferase family 39 protein [Thermodesulfovibrionales bacterium]|nr:glycosyltransferase family 39 protein [Thermodesulfovibrionales bacterium]
MLEWIKNIDTALFFFLNSDCRNWLFDIIMPVITHHAGVVVLPFLLLFLIEERKRAFKVFAVSFFSILLADGTAHALKEIIVRARPCNVLANVHLLVGCSKTFSLPSGHATNAFAFAVPFLLMSRSRLRYLFVFVAALVGISRVFMGVHYPFDVIAGVVVGSLCGVFLVFFYRWAERRFRDRPHTTVLSVFLLVLSIFRIYFIFYGPLHLSPDEAHYWEWSRRLDLSYYSKGPMIAYLIAGGTALFGDNVLGVRVLAVVFSLLSSLILYRLGKEMFDERVGTASAILFQLIPLYSTFGIIFTIDSPFIFFWIVSLHLFYKAVNSYNLQLSFLQAERACLSGGQVGNHSEQQEGFGTSRNARINSGQVGLSGCKGDPLLSPLGKRRSEGVYWILLGVAMGFGLLTKYTMAFFCICALLYLIFSANRKILKTSGPYVSFVVSLVVFSPVIIWNISHDWVTLKHTAGQAHIADGLRVSLRSFFEFAGSQLGVLTPVICVLIVVALRKVGRFRVQNDNDERAEALKEKGRFLLWFSVPVVGFFLLKSLQGKVQANWAMMGYVTGIIAFSAVFIGRWESYKRRVKIMIAIGIILSSLGAAVVHYPSKFHIPLKLDPSARLRGWKELGRAADTLYHGIRVNGGAFVFSDSYQVSSELAFYMEGHPVTYCINLGRRMNQYDLWPGFDRLMHSDAIFVTIGDAGLPPVIRDAFGDHSKYLHRVYEKGKLLREYSLFVCRNFRGIKEEMIRSY